MGSRDSTREYRRGIKVCLAVLGLVLVAAIQLATGGGAPSSVDGTGTSELSTDRPDDSPTISAGAYEDFTEFAYNDDMIPLFIRGVNARIPWTTEIRASIIVGLAQELCDAYYAGRPTSALQEIAQHAGFAGRDSSVFVHEVQFYFCT